MRSIQRLSYRCWHLPTWEQRRCPWRWPGVGLFNQVHPASTQQHWINNSMSHSPITFIVIFVNIQWANQEAIDKTLGANLWHETSPCQTHTLSPTYKTPHAIQELQPIKRLPISPPSIVILWALTSSSQLPLKLPGHGTRWLLNWFKRLADGSHLSPRTAERQYFCSSACPLPFNGEMRSPSSACSLPPINHPLQSFLA